MHYCRLIIINQNTIERDSDHGLGTPEENLVGSSAQNAVAPLQMSTRSGRSVRFPRRFDDYLPGMRTTALAHIPSKENRLPPQVIVNPDSPGVFNPATGVDENSGADTARDESPDDNAETVTTDADAFGVYRVFTRKPVYDPLHSNTHCDSDGLSLDPVESGSDSRTRTTPNQGPPHPEIQTTPYYHPFSNPTAAAAMVAHHSGTPVKSIQETTKMLRIIGSLGSDINPVDLVNFDGTLEHKRLDAYLASASESVFHREDGWLESTVQIRLPLDQTKMPESSAVEFRVGGVFHRDIIDVISSVYQSDVVRSFNHVPFKQFWKPSEDSPPERLYGEVFSSRAMLDADEEICKRCQEDDLFSGSDLEAVTVPLLLYSDSTHLANFGTASCWPVYMFFGSQSKYVRDKPTSSACHHIAYMPEVGHVHPEGLHVIS
jgi:hypothetical protein